MEPQDTITIAPSVLLTIAKHAATEVKGVARMGQIPVQVGRLLRGNPMANGVVLEIDDNQVSLDLYLVVKPNVNMRTVSEEVQTAVKRSIEDLVGMDVEKIGVHVEDVDYIGTSDQ